jgi:hypothetical protein
MEFAYLTGWRLRSEVLTLQWKQVDFEAGEVRLEPGTTKNDEGRTFPFAVLPELEAMLRRQRERTDALQKETGRIIPWVFHHNGKRIVEYRKSWQTATEKVGLVGRIPHDFRRTAVRNLERAGVPRSVAMKLVGHKTESIYRRYAIVARQGFRGWIEAPGGLPHQPGQNPGGAEGGVDHEHDVVIGIWAAGLRSAPAGMVQHGRAEDSVDAGLISLSLGFKPRKDIGIDPERERLLDGTIKLAGHRTVPVPHFRKIGQVNVARLHFLQVPEFLFLVMFDFVHSIAFHAELPFAPR